MAGQGTSRRIRSACFIEVQDLKDLGRLACAFERAPLPVFAIKTGEALRLSVQVDLFMGRPVFYYFLSQSIHHFLGYRNSGGVEEVVLAASASNPVYINAPVIWMEKVPKVFQQAVGRAAAKGQQYLSGQVKDLASLAKICSYKTLFEEPPLPLFLYKYGEKWVLGSFTHMDEVEEASIFFYVLLPEPPPTNFLRFSSRDMASTGFTARIDEHGYVFIKIIRLAQEHPLVEIG